jgi:hypothetical protein
MDAHGEKHDPTDSKNIGKETELIGERSRTEHLSDANTNNFSEGNFHDFEKHVTLFKALSSLVIVPDAIS